MTKVQIMRQEAIYELFNGEIEIVQDLKTLKEVCDVLAIDYGRSCVNIFDYLNSYNKLTSLKCVIGIL